MHSENDRVRPTRLTTAISSELEKKTEPLIDVCSWRTQINAMNRDSAIGMLRFSKLGPRFTKIEPYLAPSVRIRTARDPAAGKALVSRFAGHGVLPRGASWPLWDNGPLCRRWVAWREERIALGRGSRELMQQQIERQQAEMQDNPKPIDFLAMVRLADVAPHAPLLGLPGSGALLFFYDVQRMLGSFQPEARGGWRILYVEDEDDLVVVDDPPIHHPDFQPSTLSFDLEYALPEDIRKETGDDDLRCYGNDEYGRVYKALRGIGDKDPIIHQVGGHPVEIQNGLFRQCQLASNGVCGGSPEDADRQRDRVRALEPGARDWRLVLQIDSDKAGPGWMWGDVGRLYYCVHRDDLAARRFDRSWCSEQCG